MCFPAMGLIGAAVSAVGSMAAASAGAAQDKYNAQVARINANTARQTGQADAARITDKYDKLEGQQRVAAAKSGIDPSSGSAALIIAQENARNSWLDTSNAIWNKETEAVGYENKARDLEAQAKAKKQAGMFSAGSSFLSGLTRSMRGAGSDPLSITG